MNFMIALAAAVASGALALMAIVRRRATVSNWTFCAGMIAMATVSALEGLSMKATGPEEMVRCLSLAMVAKSFIPALWLAFSLAYSRGNSREFLLRWRLVLALFILPAVLAIVFRGELLQVKVFTDRDSVLALRFSAAGKVLNGLLLIGSVLILTNLEKTLRAAVGTMRWRIKFVVLGLGLIFGSWIYTYSQALLFSTYDPNLTAIETAALLIGCLFIGFAYARSGFAEVDVYPSYAVLQSSVIILLVGAYLLIVGVLAQVVAHFGGAGSFQGQALVVLLGVAVLAVVGFSERARQWLQQLVSRHFQRSTHDYRKVWTQLTLRMSRVLDEPGFCSTAATFISETFKALSVTIWLVDEQGERFALGASTSPSGDSSDRTSRQAIPVSSADLANIRHLAGPTDLESQREDWANALKERTAGQFRHGGRRLCIPLTAGDRVLGIAVLADRVNGVPYGFDELDLLKCIADQLGAGLLNLRLTQDLMRAKELEAFQTMSTFFVHDLKNAASSLDLTLRNLPLHFDNPEFRKDALRALGNSVGRINHFIQRLTALRRKLELHREEADLNQLIRSVLDGIGPMPEIEVVTEFNATAAVLADREHLGSVVTNLVLNARDAVAGKGRIAIKTSQQDSRAVITVTDNGCGMTEEFIRESLFRPFHTTKKQGLGIGMFQSKLIVEAHGGSMIAISTPGQGTTFTVTLPLHTRV